MRTDTDSAPKPNKGSADVQRARPGSATGILVLLTAAALVVLSAVFIIEGEWRPNGPPAVDLGESVEGHPVEVEPADLDELGVADDGHTWSAPGEVVWPDRATFTVPVSGGGSAEVTVHDQLTARGLGIAGVVIEVETVDEGSVDLAVNYRDWKDAFGGGWAGRLELVELPECALTTPERESCRVQNPVAGSSNDPASSSLTATVETDGGQSPAVYAATAEAADATTGDYTATDLNPAGSWSHAGASGAFTYAYPIEAPEVPGIVPEIALAYSSQAVDGRTSGRNGQASWVGDGWGYHPGFIERTYVTCGLDDDGNNAGNRTGDRCWDGDSPSVTMALDGTNTTLVLDDVTGRWHAAGDEGWNIELLGSTATDSQSTSERWRITDNDGTQYYFGARASDTDSRLSVPVYGNHSGEACYTSGDFEGSVCDQAWRWMLDKIVDVHGNIALFEWNAETGQYGAANDTGDLHPYDRSAYLTRIDYGLRSETGEAAARVDFTVADRCLSSCGTAADPIEANWPDTPWDLDCDAAPCDQHAPVFFSTKRLDTITTRVNTDSGWADAARWNLSYEFKEYGDTDQTVLWLKTIQHTGLAGGEASTPPVTFAGQMLPNRVDHDDKPVMWRWRISAITTETGGVIGVRYNEPDCGAGDLPTDLATNGRLCYPVWWTPPEYWEPERDYFHKYVVTEIFQQDTTAGQPVAETFYDYSTSGGGTNALWAWDDSEFTDDEHRTWSQWRGYTEVTATSGHPDDGPQTVTVDRYYRGMDGQPTETGGTGDRPVKLTDSLGNEVTDHEALTGAVFESYAFDEHGLFQADTNRYWTQQTAERAHDGGELKAWMTAVDQTDSRLLLDSATDTWRQTHVEYDYDSRGRLVRTSDLGDLSVSNDQRCVRTYYADNPDLHLYNLVKRTDEVAVDCSQTPSRPDDVISGIRNYYDGHASIHDQPDRGLLTETSTVTDHDGNSSATVRTMSAEYDALGRETNRTDAAGNTTTTAYTPADGGAVTETVTTNPLGHTTSVHFDPVLSAETRTIDPNGRETITEYDPLGRVTAVWGPERETTEAPTAAFDYAIDNTAPSSVTVYGLTPTGEQILSSVELYDSLLRPVQSQTPNAIGGRLVTSTTYDTRGNIAYESGPNWLEDTEPGTDLIAVDQGADHARTFYTYDAAGRETSTQFMSHQEILWETATYYGGSTEGWMVRTDPRDGATPTATITNAHGEPVATRDFHGPSAEGTFDETTYAYDQRGLLNTVTDPAGNQWTYEYDLRGRMIAVHDPDTGTTTAVYDDLDRIIQTTDARGETVSVEYDALDRTIARWDGDAGTGTLLADWVYDTEPGGLGLPARANAYPGGTESDPIITQVGNYDSAGRPQGSRTIIPAIDGLESLAGTYTISQSFLSGGQLSRINYPQIGGIGSEAVVYHYNDLGQATHVFGNLTGSGNPNGETYVKEATYTPWGELAQRVLGDGAEGTVQSYQTWTFEDGTRRTGSYLLSRDAPEGTAVADLAYTYDQAGNITSIADTAADAPSEPERQCFVYDHLQRLTDAWAQAGEAACTDRIALDHTDLGGPAPYWQTYEYDATGNRTTVTDHHADGTTTNSEYTYTPDQAHLIDTVTEGGQTEQYSWDAAGNLTSRTLGEQSETLEWNAEGKLTTITGEQGTTAMYYDADNNRIARLDTDGTQNLYLPGHEISVDPQGIKHVTRTYEHDGEMIATRSTDTGLTWIGTTHQGTAVWAIAAATGAVTYRRQDPYGNTRGEQTDWTATQRGFHTGTEDPTGLVSMGARFYDPDTGRFVSRDPIRVLGDTQQINGYAYASNSPITMDDSTGLLGKKSGKISKNTGKGALKQKKKSSSTSSGKHGKTRNVSSGNSGKGQQGSKGTGRGAKPKPQPNLKSKTQPKPIPTNPHAWAQVDGPPIGPINDCNCDEDDWLDDLLGGEFDDLWGRAEPHVEDCITGIEDNKNAIIGSTIGGALLGAGAGAMFAGVGAVPGAITGAAGGFGASVGGFCGGVFD